MHNVLAYLFPACLLILGKCSSPHSVDFFLLIFLKDFYNPILLILNPKKNTYTLMCYITN